MTARQEACSDRPVRCVAGSFHEANNPSQTLFGLRALAGQLVGEGIDPERMFDGTGLAYRDLDQPDARMRLRQRLEIYRNAQRLAKAPDFAIRAGKSQPLSDYGVFGFAYASQSTLRDAVLFSARNLGLAGPVLHIRYEEHGDQMVFSSHGYADLEELLPFAVEFLRGCNVNLMERALKAPLRSQRMLFPYRAPAHWRSYEAAFGCAVEFDAGVLEWHLGLDSLELGLPRANPVNAGILETLCHRMLSEQNDNGTGVVQRVRNDLERHGCAASAADVARRVNMSTRSMFRHLAAEGLSFQELVDDVRREAAMSRLQDRARSIDDIGRELGFSEATNFSKAFRRWTGVAPGKYRQSLGEPRGVTLVQAEVQRRSAGPLAN